MSGNRNRSRPPPTPSTAIGNVTRSEKIARVISLPVLVDPDGAKASFKNGVLTVRMPEKAEVEEGGKKVKIE